MVLTPTYHVFNMYKVHQDAEFIPVDYESKNLLWTEKGAVPSLSVTASRKDGAVHVSLVNPSIDQTSKVVLNWETLGAASKAKVSGTVLNAKDIRDYNDFGQAPKVCPEKFTGVKKTAKGLEFEMPAASIITLEIR